LRDAETKIEKLEEQARALNSTDIFVPVTVSTTEAAAGRVPGSWSWREIPVGEEAETYGELIFANNWLNPERDSDKGG